MAEVVAHQLLDTLPRPGAGIAEHLRGPFLQLVAQDVLVASALEVQRGAHPQEEILRVVEARRIGGAAAQEQRIREQRNRARGRQIAQRAGRVLHVGLELIQRRVELRVPLLDQRQQRTEDEGVCGRPMKEAPEALEHRARARHRTRVEQREQELGIVGLELAQVREVAHLVADDDAEVPERIQEIADEALLRRTDAVAEEQQQIDVGMEAQVAAAVAAEREDRHGAVVRARLGEELPDERVHAIRVPLQRAAAAGTARDRRAQFSPGRVERRLQRGAGRIRLRYRHAGNIPGLARPII